MLCQVQLDTIVLVTAFFVGPFLQVCFGLQGLGWVLPPPCNSLYEGFIMRAIYEYVIDISYRVGAVPQHYWAHFMDLKLGYHYIFMLQMWFPSYQLTFRKAAEFKQVPQ